MNLITSFRTWWRGTALAETPGQQNPVPGASLVADAMNIGSDGAMQISAVWACIDRRATTIASLPLFTYLQKAGVRTLARATRLYALLHDSPNSRMTAFEFWRALVMNHDLRGNAYARVDRDANGEAVALWPMPADQVETRVLPDGEMVYLYSYGNDIAVLAAANVLHIKNLGNGTTGLAKLEFMRATTDEVAKSQMAASKVFGSGGKPTGVLMIDKLLTDKQRDAIRKNFEGMTEGNTSRLYVLEANMDYKAISMTPEQVQLLETRKYGVEEICRWFDVPPVLIHHSNVTAWGSGIEQLIEGFYTLSIRPMLVNIEQAVGKRVLTSAQRAGLKVEFALEALLRGNLKQRMEVYAQATQNGLKTRNECRQLENDPPVPGGDELTAQSNLVPITMLGKVVASGGNGSRIAQ